jgi:hypothetical protein
VSYEWLLNGDATEKISTRTAHDRAASLSGNTEKQLLRMFNNLSGSSRYKVLGYVERICIEDLGEKVGSRHSKSLYMSTGGVH